MFDAWLMDDLRESSSRVNSQGSGRVAKNVSQKESRKTFPHGALGLTMHMLCLEDIGG